MTTTIIPSIPDILQKCGVTAYKLVPHSIKGRYSLACPLPDHADSEHRDGSGSFSISESGACRCFGCGWTGHITKLPAALGGGVSDAPKSYRQDSKPKASKSQAEPLQGATLEQLASNKGLPTEWLEQELSWRDGTYGRGRRAVPAILMPYYDMKGKPQFQRYRVGITSKDRFRWELGAKMMAYGLQYLDSYDDSYVLLVEGETDFAACRYAGLQVLGIPGAGVFNVAMADAIRRFETVYLWQEPDQGGTTLLAKVSSQFQNLKTITSLSAKDPCELAQLTGPKFFAQMTALMEQAEVYVPPEVHWTDHLDAAGRKQHEANREAYTQLTSDSIPASGLRLTYRDDEGEVQQLSPVGIYIRQSKASQRESEKIYMILSIQSHGLDHVEIDPYPMENRAVFPALEDLIEYLKFADGQYEKGWTGLSNTLPRRNPKLVAQESCQQNGHLTCEDHGRKKFVPGNCGLKSCPYCPTRLASKLGKVKLPEGTYRAVWLKYLFPLGLKDDYAAWGNAVNQAWKRCQEAMSRINTNLKSPKLKVVKESRLLHRAAAYHMDWPFATMHLKLTFWEPVPGECDKAINKLMEHTGGEIIHDSVIGDPVVAQLHMIGAATASLISVDAEEQHDMDMRKQLFAAYWEGTKGEHLNRPLDWLETMVNQVPKPEPELCDECGAELKWARDLTPGDQTTNPTHPDYAWPSHGPPHKRL